MATKKTSSERITPKNTKSKSTSSKTSKTKVKTSSLTLKDMAKELSNDGLIAIDLMIPDNKERNLRGKMEKLYNQERVVYAIPFDLKEVEGATQEVIWNFIRFTIPKQTMVSLPQSIFEILKQSFNIKEADRHLRADSNEGKIAALN